MDVLEVLVVSRLQEVVLVAPSLAPVRLRCEQLFTGGNLGSFTDNGDALVSGLF